MNPQDRFKDYQGDKCWQAYISEVNRDEDLAAADLTEEEAQMLRTSDFVFEAFTKEAPFIKLNYLLPQPQGCDEMYNAFARKQEKVSAEHNERVARYPEVFKEVKAFIERHEWLAKLPNRPTHIFTARLKKNGTLAGVIIMAIPNAFSNILGKENQDKERLISRGACISWGPKNLGSWLIKSSIQWMCQNTQYRYFTAYSDPEAKELGTIYQACNFIYLGQSSGTNEQFLDPRKPERGWFSGREFRKKSAYMKYAKSLTKEYYLSIGMPDYETRMFGFISWEKAKKTPASDSESKPLAKKWVPDWKVMDQEYPGLSKKLKEKAKEYEALCESRKVPAKHKYVCLQGRSKKETRILNKLFESHNPDKTNLPYPQERGK